MLKLILGRAGTGKTACVMNEIRDRALSGETGLVLLVPEQYSHDAERRLCAVVGDSLSLHGEVLSFTRLASRVFSETGGGAGTVIDAGGRVLTMYRAITSVQSMLHVYGGEGRRADFLEKMLLTYDELKRCGVTPETLANASFEAERGLSDKLMDMSLIFDAYDAALAGAAVDPGDVLTNAADALEKYGALSRRGVYVDGFTDFTVQEERILDALLKNGADMTVCLTCDGIDSDTELFSASRRAARRLISLAEGRGIEISIREMTHRGRDLPPALAIIEEKLFSGEGAPSGGTADGLELFRAASRSEEYELAAARVIELVKQGYRYRDIAVVSCEWDSYGGLMESIFEKYGVPVYLNRKTDILQKPAAALIGAALDTVASGWEYESVFAYLRSGLTGVPAEEIDLLENYVLTWNIRGSMWTRREAWDMPLSGYGERPGENDDELLSAIDRCRRRVAAPLKKLRDSLRAAETGGGHVRALFAFLEDIGFCDRLAARSESLRKEGSVQLADEYAQLWSILKTAMEQFDGIMGGQPLSIQEFARLWQLLVSRYDVASIPVALDRVGLGDIARHRRRDVKCLIVTGAYDGALPRAAVRGGLLSDSEREALRSLGIDAFGGGDEELYREMYDVYASLTLPSELLVMTYPADAASGRASYILTRLKALTNAVVGDADIRRCRLAAPMPRMELAVSGDRTAERLLSTEPSSRERLDQLKTASASGRQRLTRETAKLLYGKRVHLSASRVDQFASCQFAFFLRFGLRAKPRRRASFDSPVYGTFMHYILENVTREVKNGGGFREIDEGLCRELTRKYVRLYADRELGGMGGKTSRFIYLFRRLAAEAEDIVLDMLGELKNSEFAPIDFELSFSSGGDVPPYTLEEDGAQLAVDGIVDRVDGWVHDGRLYLRVIDYKTGKKSFSLSDIWYGMGMQMLIYLFALAAEGKERYKMEIVPAGVLYVPAREMFLNLPRDTTQEQLVRERTKALRRSGLILSEEDVIEAMGRGEGRKYLPVKFSKDGVPIGDSLASLEKMGLLAKHIDATLREIGRELMSGDISADPYFKNQMENACRWCEFRRACHFSEEDGDARRFLPTLKTGEIWDRLGEEAKNG